MFAAQLKKAQQKQDQAMEQEPKKGEKKPETDSEDQKESVHETPYWEKRQSKSSKEVIEYMYENVYPDLTLSLKELISYLEKSREVHQHLEKTYIRKFFDEEERKRLQVERDKELLGSDYVSSGDEMDSMLIDDEDDLEGLQLGGEAKDGEQLNTEVEKQHKQKFTEIAPIQEIEQEQFYESDDNEQLSSTIRHTPWQAKIKPFNAVKFLVTSLRRRLKEQKGKPTNYKDDPIIQQPLPVKDTPYEAPSFFVDPVQELDSDIQFKKGVPYTEQFK